MGEGGEWPRCECEQAGSLTSAPFQALAKSLGLQMPVVVQSMYIFKVSSLSSPDLSLPSEYGQGTHTKPLLLMGQKLLPQGITKFQGEHAKSVSSG